MARFGFVGPTYQSESPNVDAQRTMNWVPEVTENPSAASSMGMYPTWGLKQFATLSPGTCVNGLYYSQDYQELFVTTGVAYGQASTYGTFVIMTLQGTQTFSYPTFPGDNYPVQMVMNGAGASGFGQVLINPPFEAVYLWRSGLPFGVPATPPVDTFSHIGYIDGYFIGLVNPQNASYAGAFQLSNLNDGTTWNAANVFKISVFSEPSVAMLVAHRNVWFWSPKHAVVYADVGDPNNPLQPIPGAFMEQGISAIFSPICIGNQVYWLGASESGEPMAWTAQGWTPKRVSTHAVETAWQRYKLSNDAISCGWQQHGHFIWQLYFPTADATWRYDIDSGLWHEAGAWDPAKGVYHAHHSMCHAYAGALGGDPSLPAVHLVGDTQSPTIYYMGPQYYDDNGSPIRRYRRAPHVGNELEWTFHHKLRVHLETGLGPTPPLTGVADGVVQLAAQDTNGVYWMFNVTDAGVWESQTYASLQVTPYTFADIGLLPYQLKCYALGVSTAGVPYAIPLFNPPGLPTVTGYIKHLNMATYPGSLQSGLSVQYGQLVIDPPAPAYRDPQVMLRYSDDGGHTWSNEYVAGAGFAGEFRKRVEWRALGRSRDRVYEISVSDPIPWRIVDAYLHATPGYEPIQRYSTQIQKMA